MVSVILTLLVVAQTPIKDCKVVSSDRAKLYYTKAVTEREAQLLLNYLLKIKLLKSERFAEVQLDRAGKTYEYRVFNVKETALKSPTYLAAAKEVGKYLSKEVFNGAPVDVHLCESYTTDKLVKWDDD